MLSLKICILTGMGEHACNPSKRQKLRLALLQRIYRVLSGKLGLYRGPVSEHVRWGCYTLVVLEGLETRSSRLSKNLFPKKKKSVYQYHYLKNTTCNFDRQIRDRQTISYLVLLNI